MTHDHYYSFPSLHLRIYIFSEGFFLSPYTHYQHSIRK